MRQQFRAHGYTRLSKRKSLLVCGSGRTLFPDLQAVADLTGPLDECGIPADLHEDFDIMAINDAFLALPHVDFLASYHDELIWSWLMLRGPREYVNNEYKTTWRGVTYSQRRNKGVKQVRVMKNGGGSSSFYGVEIGLEEGYDRIILCGVPFDVKGRFYHAPWMKGHNYAASDGWEAWVKAKEAGELDAVRSMSGMTCELLGKPNEAWLWRSYNATTD